MKNVVYSDAPDDINDALDHGVIVTDFLPAPDKLVFKAEKEKITIAIDRRSLELYREYAKKHNTKYQTMINSVVGSYADKFLTK